MVARTLLGAALLLSLSLSTEAQALCRDDLQDVKTKIDEAKTVNPERYGLALKWWGRAQEAEPGSEVECLNFLAQARKSLSDPLPDVPGCTAANAGLPNCNGVAQNGMGFIQVVPVGPVQAIGGGGGGGGAALPVTAGGSSPFNPPGSPGAGNQGGEATGTDR